VIGILNIWKINGVKMKNKDFFYAMIVSLMFGLLVVSIVSENKKELPSVQTKVDTTSQEYYKKSLDSFFFEHSKIPNE
jgi:hypothetical protein